MNIEVRFITDDGDMEVLPGVIVGDTFVNVSGRSIVYTFVDGGIRKASDGYFEIDANRDSYDVFDTLMPAGYTIERLLRLDALELLRLFAKAERRR